MTAFNMGQIDVGYLGSPPAILRHLTSSIQTEIVSLANDRGVGRSSGMRTCTR